MQANSLPQIQSRMQTKRQEIEQWLETTPDEKKRVQLGPSDEDKVQAHLHVIDGALQSGASGELGRCRVCHQFVGSAHIEMDYTADVCIDHLTREEIRQLEMELELSQSLQRALLPQQAPDIPGLELAVFSRPAQILGGDYFDFVRFKDEAPGLAIADVMGHGFSSGLLMASVQAALRTLVPDSLSPLEVLGRMNRLFLHNAHFTTFVTLFLGRFDPQAGVLTYANAGHNPPLHIRRTNEGSWLAPTAPAIGLVEGFTAQEARLRLASGDTLLLYTDGVTEAFNPQEQMFGQERLAALAYPLSSASAREQMQSLRRGLQEFTAGRPLDDDTTILICKML